MKIKLIFYSLVFFYTISIKAQITVKTTHPRILLDATIIPKLQSRTTNNTLEWQELTTRINAISGYSSKFIMQNVYEGQQYAFMYTLSFYASGNVSHRDSAISLFKEYFNKYTKDSTMFYDSGYESRSTMVDVAMLYDWLYNYMTPSFRNSVKNRLVVWGNWILTKPNIYGIWYGPYYDEGNNYSMGHFVGLTSVGFAIHSEDNINGNYFISKSDSIRSYFMHFANTRLKHGDANEGWGYGAGYAVNYFKALAIYKTATINALNHFANTTYDEDVAIFLPHATLPNLTHMLPEGDWARESTGELWEYHKYVADLVSSYSDNIQAQQVAVFWGKETVPFNRFAVTAYRWLPFLYSNQEITPLNYRTLSTYQTNYIHTDTIGTDQFIRRKGWTPNDQWVSYRAGGRHGDHAHNGSGHFSVYKNGWLLVDKNILSSSGIEGSDSMHNCIHIQNMNNIEMYSFGKPTEKSELIRKDLQQEYSYLWTNSHPIFDKRGQYTFNCVEKNQRQFLYIPEIEKIALYDIVETGNNYNKWFGLNYFGNASLSTDSSYTYYSNTQNTAYVHTCFPLAKQVSVYNGNSVRVRYKTNIPKNYFMHLVSTLSNSIQPSVVLPVNRYNGRVLLSDFYGSYHADNIKDYCLLFAGDDSNFNHDSLIYQVPATAKMLHSYIAGVTPNTNFYISWSIPTSGILNIKVSIQPHANSLVYTSSAGGILSFDLLSSTVGINTLQNKGNYHIFYNKDEEVILIDNNLYENNLLSNISMYDGLGKRVYHTSVNTNTTDIPTTHLSNGVYIIVIESEKSNYRKKVIIY